MPADDTGSLARFFHLNSEPHVPVSGLPADDPAPAPRDVDDIVPLPDAVETSPLLDLLGRRRSCRRFRVAPMPSGCLATLLAGTYGVLRHDRLADGSVALARPVPSAGARYPLELDAVTQRVVGIPDGLYRYNPVEHALERWRPTPTVRDLERCCLGQDYFEEANAVVLFSAVFDRTLRRYGARGYRHILLEAGHAAQNFCLLATEAGLGSLVVGGFADRQLNRLVGLDGVAEAVLYCVAVGQPAEA